MSIEALKRIVAAVEAIPEDIEGWMPDALTDALIDARQAITAYESAPPECQTEAEKTAFAFGWWKAMETKRAEKQEPFGVMCINCGSSWSDERLAKEKEKNADLIACCPERKMVNVYIHPQPKREWVGLTDEQIHIRYKAMRGDKSPRYIEIYRDCENAHGIKGK